MDRFKAGRRPVNTNDDAGTVRVVITRVDGAGHFIKGSVTKCMTFRDAKVSDVYAAIKHRLTGNNK